MPYPSEAEEMEILTQFHQMGNTNVLSTIEPVLKAEQLVSLRKQVKNIVIEEKLLQFIAKLVHQTRNHKSIYLGGSPRASLAIMNASKAYAAINGRDFVTPEDILEVVPPVLRHRSPSHAPVALPAALNVRLPKCRGPNWACRGPWRGVSGFLCVRRFVELVLTDISSVFRCYVGLPEQDPFS